MSEQMRAEFEAWASKGFGLVRGHFVRAEDEYENFPTQCYWEVWQAARKPVPALIETLRENGDLIAAQATIAQQAQMIEYLRGRPTPLYTSVDMTSAAADGFRDGAASVVVELPQRIAFDEKTLFSADERGEFLEHFDVVRAIVAAGGRVKE